MRVLLQDLTVSFWWVRTSRQNFWNDDTNMSSGNNRTCIYYWERGQEAAPLLVLLIPQTLLLSLSRKHTPNEGLSLRVTWVGVFPVWDEPESLGCATHRPSQSSNSVTLLLLLKETRPRIYITNQMINRTNYANIIFMPNWQLVCWLLPLETKCHFCHYQW